MTRKPKVGEYIIGYYGVYVDKKQYRFTARVISKTDMQVTDGHPHFLDFFNIGETLPLETFLRGPYRILTSDEAMVEAL